VLDDLDLDAPVAITPLAQVHRGALGGAPVAVKVRRAGLDNAVRADLSLLDALRPPLRGAFPSLDAGMLLRRIREQALDELDLEHEAAQQRAVGRALRDVEGVVVPTTHSELAGGAVLVSGWLDGPTLADHDPADPSAVAEALVAAHVTAARGGLVLIDPRPNHVVLLEDGRVGLLGTGNAVAADRGRLSGLLTLPAALRDADPAPFARAVHAELGLLPDAASAHDAHALLRELLGDLVAGPARVDGAALETVGARALRRLPEVFALLARGAPDPGDIWLARGMAQLAAVLSVIGAEEDWVALVG
jgi:predicted unusual protein kinase regulating ubiquinone biosynthesis (AarF/ABC1/UbiB family)